eukprot:XP_021124298.2 uncharacterized protein LOC101792103 isoform X1 [Anas platyrhynchos]
MGNACRDLRNTSGVNKRQEQDHQLEERVALWTPASKTASPFGKIAASPSGWKPGVSLWDLATSFLRSQEDSGDLRRSVSGLRDETSSGLYAVGLESLQGWRLHNHESDQLGRTWMSTWAAQLNPHRPTTLQEYEKQQQQSRLCKISPMHVSPSADFSLYLASGAERPLPTQTVLRFSDGSAWDGATDLEVVVYDYHWKLNREIQRELILSDPPARCLLRVRLKHARIQICASSLPTSLHHVNIT